MDGKSSKEFNGSGDSLGAEQLKRRNSPGSDSSEEMRKAVQQCLSSSSGALDISRRNIKHLSKEIYLVPCIKYLHLERNLISTVPEDFFQGLPHLVWLDLRWNRVRALPPGIGCHRQLKTLLLERNPIKELPAEFGNLTSLTALNLRDCPLEFPPRDVVQKGLKSVLCFLQEFGKMNKRAASDMSSNMEDKTPCSEGPEAEMPPVEKLNLSELDLSDEWPNEEEKMRFQKLKEAIMKAEREEFLAEERVGAAHGVPEAGKELSRNRQLCWESARRCR